MLWWIHLQDQVKANVCVSKEMIQDALDQLRGAVMIVYPMGLPPHDPIRLEFEDKEDLQGQHVSVNQGSEKGNLPFAPILL